MSKVGFTGTRYGMTEAQRKAFLLALDELEVIADVGSEFHHGDCVGADAEAHDVMAARGFITVGHPCNMAGMRALRRTDRTHAPKPPLDRNRDIVDAADVLFACPAGMAEEQRSGTWATVRYARRIGKPVVIVYPDGSIKQEGGK